MNTTMSITMDRITVTVSVALCAAPSKHDPADYVRPDASEIHRDQLQALTDSMPGVLLQAQQRLSLAVLHVSSELLQADTAHTIAADITARDGSGTPPEDTPLAVEYFDRWLGRTEYLIAHFVGGNWIDQKSGKTLKHKPPYIHVVRWWPLTPEKSGGVA